MCALYATWKVLFYWLIIRTRCTHGMNGSVISFAALLITFVSILLELPHPDAATAAEARRKRRTSMMEISQRG